VDATAIGYKLGSLKTDFSAAAIARQNLVSRCDSRGNGRELNLDSACITQPPSPNSNHHTVPEIAAVVAYLFG
jgi:hypothetical protein